VWVIFQQGLLINLVNIGIFLIGILLIYGPYGVGRLFRNPLILLILFLVDVIFCL